MSYEALQKQIADLIEREDNESLERLVTEHFEEFPDEIKGKIILAFVEETLDKKRAQQEIQNMQMAGLEAMEKLEALKAVLQLPED